MNIAVIDIAAESSGGLSVLKDFHQFLIKSNEAKKHNWTIFTSVIDLKESDHIVVKKYKWIKKSWIHRAFWELYRGPQIMNSSNYDLIISLQNMAFFGVYARQIVYFHNVLLTQREYKFSITKSIERKLWVYQNIIGPITRLSLKRSWKIITQTETVRNQLAFYNPRFQIKVIRPNVNLQGIIVDTDNCTFTSPKDGIIKFIYPATPMSFKNHKKIIDALIILNRDYKIEKYKVFFTIDGSENSYSRQLVEKCKSISQIECIGYIERNRLIKYYRECALLLTSRIESFPFPIIEAMMFSSPIISLPFDYSKEILKNYGNALLSDNISAESLAKSIKKYIDNFSSYNNNCGLKLNTEFKNSWEHLLEIIES